jgi:uncharacterized protein YqgC (DUF456 family)
MALDITWSVLGGILMVVGLLGCFLPIIPGPPLSYFGLMVLQFKEQSPFSTKFLIIWAVVVVAVTALDYVVPAYGTKKFGGTKYGIWGCTIGLILGFWLGPMGIILGPFFGALIGELIGGKDSNQAFKAALGSFVGFLVGTLLKLIVCGVMCWYFVKALL